MARYGWRSTTESQHRVDVRYLHKQGWLKAGCMGSLSWTCRGEPSGSIQYRVKPEALILEYRTRSYGGEWHDVTERVPLEYRPCNYGGFRPWLHCPHCNRRVAVLYGGVRFLCRHCHDLAYASQQETPVYRLLRKVRNISERLGGSGNLLESFPSKPKGMHWMTYWRLREKGEQAELESLQRVLRRFRP